MENLKIQKKMVFVVPTLHDPFYPNPTRKVGFFVSGRSSNGP